MSKFNITVLEKHFTIDKSLPGPDHTISLNPDELKEHISAINAIHESFSKGINTRSDKDSRDNMRRGVYYNNDLGKGSHLTLEDLYFTRPYNSVSPMQVKEYIGKKLTRMFQAFSILLLRFLIKLLVIVQARINSSRLPAKILLPFRSHSILSFYYLV